VASEVLPHVKFALVSAEGADKQGVMQTFFQTLAAGTVPIVIGAADIKVAHIRYHLHYATNLDPFWPLTTAYARPYNHSLIAPLLPTASQELSPSPSSLLSVSSAAAVPSLIQQVQRLLKNDSAYDALLAYKHEGPSDEFLALMDVATSPPDCRLCTLLADRQRTHERADKPRDRPCACRDRVKGERTKSVENTVCLPILIECLCSIAL
jgi:hypothetical protein